MPIPQMLEFRGGQTSDTPVSRKRIVRLRLDTSTDCQRALARLIRSTMAGKIATSDLSRYANALMVLARLIEGGDLEKRLEALEAQT